MRRFITGAAVVAALVMSPQLVLGQDFIGRDLQAVETFQYAGGSGVTALWNHVQVGPYSADLITSGNPTVPGITLYCVDFANGVSSGATWDANITELGTGASDATLGNTRLGTTAGNLNLYKKTAFLSSLFSSWASYTSSTYSYGSVTYSFGSRLGVWSGIHAAIWSITNASFPGAYSATVNVALANAMASPFLTLANTALTGGFVGMDFDQWAVATDTDLPLGYQEFLVNTAVVPEPGTWVLLLSGLGLLFFVGRKRFQEFVEEV